MVVGTEALESQGRREEQGQVGANRRVIRGRKSSGGITPDGGGRGHNTSADKGEEIIQNT